MTYLVVSLAAFITALLTLFSGFGLGTLLLPVFAVFFPLQIAVAATAVVHLANNLFKLGLLGRYVRGSVVVRFGGPAAWRHSRVPTSWHGWHTWPRSPPGRGARASSR